MVAGGNTGYNLQVATRKLRLAAMMTWQCSCKAYIAIDACGELYVRLLHTATEIVRLQETSFRGAWCRHQMQRSLRSCLQSEQQSILQNRTQIKRYLNIGQILHCLMKISKFRICVSSSDMSSRRCRGVRSEQIVPTAEECAAQCLLLSPRSHECVRGFLKR